MNRQCAEHKRGKKEAINQAKIITINFYVVFQKNVPPTSD